MNPVKAIGVLLIGVMTGPGCGKAVKAAAPYPSSRVITDISFNWATHIRLAPGSDNWPITWADDDHQYTSWGDGGGFGGTDSDGRVSNGFARVQGPKSGYSGVNIAGGKNAPYPAPFPGKCHGLISINGTLYAWRDGAESGASAYDFTELWKSTNHAATWSFTGARFAPSDFNPPSDRGWFCTNFLQFGKDYAGARDGYFYIYGTNIKRTDWEVQYPGEITLMRVPTGQVENRAAYEYFAGLSGDQPVWTADRRARQPVWRDTINGVHRITVSYNAPLGRYLLWTEHTARNSGNVGIYDAPEPWGPWTTVLFDHDFASQITSGKGIIFFSFSNKWLSPDGLNFVAVMSVDDNWDTVEGAFGGVPTDPPEPATNPSPPQGAVNVSGKPTLSWTAGARTTSHDVYFGTSTPLTAADFRGSQMSAAFAPGILAVHKTCYWRIDEVNGSGTTVGSVWSFTTRYGDYDRDSDVDQEDFGSFQLCLTGSGGSIVPGCDEADLDCDQDVDLDDFNLFQSCVGGPNRPAGC